MTVKRLLRALSSDRDGTSTIELAIIVPVLALLTLVAADLAMAFKMKIGLQTAAERTAQMATKGGYNSVAYQNLAADAADAADVPTNAVIVTGSLFCNNTVQGSADAICPAGQQLKRYVAITISNSYQPMLAGLLPHGNWASDQGITLTGSASVRLQ